MIRSFRRRVPLPTLGRSDATSYTDQSQATTQDAFNVRTTDPKEGRVRITQRAGLSKFVDDQLFTQGKVDELVLATYSEPRIVYTPNTTQADFTIEWDTLVPGGATAWSVAVDRQGNVFAITSSGSVTGYNSEGVKFTNFIAPVPIGFSVVQALEIDELDYLYLSASTTVTGAAGRLWQYRPVTDTDGTKRYSLTWTITTDAPVVDFDVRVGVLAVLEASDPDSTAWVSNYGQLYTLFPDVVWRKSAPYPVNACAVTVNGDVYATCEPNPERADTMQYPGFSTFNTTWSPHALVEADTRIHSWIDAHTIRDLPAGAEVNSIDDRRFIATTATNSLSDDNVLVTGQPGGTDPSNPNAYTAPTDVLADRRCNRDDDVPIGTGFMLNGPLYDPAVGGGINPGLFFDSTQVPTVGGMDPNIGSVLRAGRSDSTAFKSDTSGDGIADANGSSSALRAFLPSHNVYFHGPSTPVGNGYVWGVAGEAPPATETAHVMCYRKNSGFNLAVVFNAVYSGTTASWGPQPGTITLVTEQAGQRKIYGIPGSIWNPPSVGNSRRNFVLTFTHGGLPSPVPTNNFTGSFRVNGIRGQAVNCQTMAHTDQNSELVWGNHKLGSKNSPLHDWGFLATIPNVRGFQGLLYESLAVLGTTTTTANDTAPTQPVYTAGPSAGQIPDLGDGEPNASGTLNPTTYGSLGAVAYTASATDTEVIEGYLAHRYGMGFVLPYTGNASPLSTGLWDSHPFGGTNYPTDANGGYTGEQAGAEVALSSPDAILAKYAAGTGEVLWAMNDEAVGYGVTTDLEGNPMTVGPTTDDVIARKIRDFGNTYSQLTSDGAWEYVVNVGTQILERTTRLSSDVNGDLFIPVRSTAGLASIRKVNTDTGVEEYQYKLEYADYALHVAFPPEVPAYIAEEARGTEFIYIAHRGGVDGGTTLTKLRTVQADTNIADGSSLRKHDVIAVGGGDIRVIRDGAVLDPEGGAGALEPSGAYVQGAQLFGQVFFVDGERYKVYDPKLLTVEDWKPRDGGSLPVRARGLTAWRGRLILFGSPDDPYNIYATELGNPYGLDIYPVTLTVTQAFRGRASAVGEAPDIVNAFIPLTDDVAVVGGDHSIWILHGDPADGGQLDLVTDQIGISYGGSWTKDPYGNLYFFSSRGGLYRMAPNGTPEPLSIDSIERELERVSLSVYDVRLVWDVRGRGLFIVPTPRVAGGVETISWFWEFRAGRLNSWWPDKYGTPGLQPSATCVFDGDAPTDRKILFGCEDGYVRFVDEEADDDDGTAIDFDLLIGPFIGDKDSENEFRFSRPRLTLASNRHGCDYEFYAASAPDGVKTRWAHGTARSGSNPTSSARTRGRYVWFRLRNARVGEGCAVESLTLEAVPGGFNPIR